MSEKRCGWCGARALRDQHGEIMSWAVSFLPRPCGPDGHERLSEDADQERMKP